MRLIVEIQVACLHRFDETAAGLLAVDVCDALHDALRRLRLSVARGSDGKLDIAASREVGDFFGAVEVVCDVCQPPLFGLGVCVFAFERFELGRLCCRRVEGEAVSGQRVTAEIAVCLRKDFLQILPRFGVNRRLEVLGHGGVVFCGGISVQHGFAEKFGETFYHMELCGISLFHCRREVSFQLRPDDGVCFFQQAEPFIHGVTGFMREDGEVVGLADVNVFRLRHKFAEGAAQEHLFFRNG